MRPIYFWKIDGWMCRQGDQGGSFSLWISPDFISTARSITVTLEMEIRLRQRALSILKDVGFDDVRIGNSGDKWVTFGEFGLMHLSVPGDACGLDWDYGNHDVERNGARLTPHNVDTLTQQSALMGIWLMWAEFVESEAS